jgi:hypothetical protein
VRARGMRSVGVYGMGEGLLGTGTGHGEGE